MDKDIIKYAFYDNGARAYMGENGPYFYIPDDEGSANPLAVNLKNGMEIWHALRAYQDEQRKKGEPILVSPMGAMDASKWYHRSYKTQDTTFEFRFGTHSHNDSKPWINVFSATNYHGVWCHAKFTNFRWRTGHGPKENTCASPNCHALGCDDCLEKGGRNG